MAQLKDTIISGRLETTNNIYVPNACGVVGYNTNSEVRNLISYNENDNTVIGYGGYNAAEGGTYIYGNNVYVKVKEAGNVQYKPYYCAGDSVTVNIRTTGYTRGGVDDIRFNITLSKPIIGNPTVTATSDRGFILIQNGKFTHDTGTNTYVPASTYSATLQGDNIDIIASMPTTTDATDLSPIAIVWSGVITFS